jgi:hypothetical protein
MPQTLDNPHATPAARRSPVNWRETVLLLIVVLGLGQIVFATWLGYGDDAFIFGRYAVNLVRGWGLAFNRGEFVEGYSSPLWLFLLSLAHMYKAPPMMAATVLGGVCWLGILFLTADPEKRFPGPLLLLVSAPIALAAGNGLETGLLMAALLFAVRRQLASDFRGAAIGLALVGLTRPEGALLVVVALVDQIRRERRISATNVAIALGPCAAYLIFRWFYFGDLLPNTFYVKTPSWELLRESFVPYFSSLLRYLPALPVLLLVGVWRAWRRDGDWLPPALALLLLILAAVGGDDRLTFRYLAPAAPILAYAAAPRLPRAALAALTVVALAASVLYLQQNAAMFIEANRRFVDSARWLAQRVPPGETVAVMYIGAVGFFNPDVAVHDLLGVTDRHIAHLPPNPDIHVRGHQKFDIPYSLSRRPEWVYFWADAELEPNRQVKFNFVDEIARRFILDPAFAGAYGVTDFFRPTGSVDGLLFQRKTADAAPAS